MVVTKIAKKAKNYIYFNCKEAKSYFYNFIKPIYPNQVRLLIFGQGRSGSTLLENLICSTGYFSEEGELLNTAKGEIRNPILYIRGLSKERAPEPFIFHVKIYQLTRDRKHPIDPAIFLNELYNDGWKIIYLRRRNKIKHGISNIVASKRNIYHKLDDKKDTFRVSIDCNELIKLVKERFMFDAAEREALSGINYHEVIYEDDLERPNAHQFTINRILDFASLENRKVSTNHQKVITQSLEELIINYDEFVDCLVKQKWQKYLEG